MVISIPALLAGAAVGIGVTMMVAGSRPPAPDLRTVLDHLSGNPTRATRPGTARAFTPAAGSGPLTRWTAHLAARLAYARPDIGSWPLTRVLRLDRLQHDLALLETPLEVLLVRKAGCALLGLLPSLLALAAAPLGSPLGVRLPATAGFTFAVLASVVPDLHVRARAAKARLEFRRAVCALLDLVALERAADAGPLEALQRATAISDTPPFLRIRRALTRADLDGVPPWHGLRDLAETTRVIELGDLADIIASSGRDGAAVCASLRARARALRTAITTAETAAANSQSEYMVIPVAALGLVFMALIAYPAMVRLVTGT